MIRIIWWHFAKGTPKTGGRPGSNGTQPIDQFSEPISEMERRLRVKLYAHWHRTSMDRLTYMWWSGMATVKHWFGIHTMLPHEEWNFIEEVVTLKGMVCWKCDFKQ